MQNSINYYHTRIVENDRHEDNFLLAQILKQNRDYLAALIYARRSIENNPYEKVYWETYSELLDHLRLSEEAQETRRNYSQFIPRDPELDAKLAAISSYTPPTYEKPPAKQISYLSNCMQHLQPNDCLRECELFISQYPFASIGYIFGAISNIRLKKYQEARNLCLIANSIDPTNVHVLLKLGDIHRLLGHFELSYSSYKRGLELQCDNYELLNNFSVLLNQNGRPSEALEHIERQLKTNPDSLHVLFNKAISLTQLHQLDDAIKVYDQIININPSFEDAHIKKALAQSDAGYYDSAIKTLQQLIRLNPKNQNAFQNLASNYAKLNKIELAIGTYQGLLKLNPQNIAGLVNLGLIFKKSDRNDDAIKLFEQALLVESGLPVIYVNLSGCYMSKRNFTKAEILLVKALKIDNSFAPTWINLGLLYSKLMKPKEALRAYKKAKALDPKNAILRNNLGNLFITLGKIDAGIKELTYAIKLDANYVEAHRHLTFAKKYENHDSHEVQIKQLISKSEFSIRENSQLRFALSKIYSDTNRFKCAYKEIKKANELAASSNKYLFKDEVNYWNRTKQSFDALTSHITAKTNYSALPVFIVGMPRTGSSLLAHRLAQHSKIMNLGETGIFESLMLKYNAHDKKLVDSEIHSIRDEFYSTLSTFGEYDVYIDKQLFNFYWLGHIKTILPEAKIINIKRSKQPTCWSIYKNYFASLRFGFSNDPENISKLYDLESQIMNFWTMKGIEFVGVDYNKLVRSPDKVLRSICKFLEVDDIIAMHGSENQEANIVNTVSAVQVREKIYTNADSDWDNYKFFCNELSQKFS